MPDARSCLAAHDTDLDGRSDVVEGCADERDTDGDGRLDMEDTDSDDDGLPDSAEDRNGDGVVDPGETDATVADTDGDHFRDGEEHTLGSDPTDPASTPGPVLILPTFGPPHSTDVTFHQTEGAPPGPVDVQVQVRNDAFGIVTAVAPSVQSLAAPGTPITFTVTGVNNSIFASPGQENRTTVELWLKTTGGIDIDLETLFVIVPAGP